MGITGGAHEVRELYSDDTIRSRDISCRFGLTSITDCLAREDLAQRTIFFDVKPISSVKRRSESEQKTLFKEDAPYILGTVYDTLSVAMRVYPEVQKLLTNKQRLGDFSEFGAAVAAALFPGYDPGIAIEYFANLEQINVYRQLRLTPEDRDLVQATCEIMKERDGEKYTNSLEEFYSELKKYISKNPKSFDGRKIMPRSRFDKAKGKLRAPLDYFGLKMSSSRSPSNLSVIEITSKK